MKFNQHATQPADSRGHTLDPVITYGLSSGVSSVVVWAVSERQCVYFNIVDFNQQEILVRTVRKRYFTSDVAANSIKVSKKNAANVLAEPYEFRMKAKKQTHCSLRCTLKKMTKSQQNYQAGKNFPLLMTHIRQQEQFQVSFFPHSLF